MFELSRYPETRLEHALNDALNMTRDDVLCPMGWRHLLRAGRRIDLTPDELEQLIDSGFLAGDGNEY